MWEYNNTEYANELYHFQIHGAKHGFRRFQNPDGSLTPAGRERYGVGPAREKHKTGFLKRTEGQSRTEKKAAKIKKKRLSEEARRAAQAKKDAIANEKKRQELMKSTDPNEILKNQHLFTNQELNDIANRLQTQQKIAALSPKTVSAGEQKINDIRQFADKMSAYGEAISNGQKAYNAFAEVMGLPSLGKSAKKTDKQKTNDIKDKLALKKAKADLKYYDEHGDVKDEVAKLQNEFKLADLQDQQKWLEAHGTMLGYKSKYDRK